jgi:hypothetical protein
MRLRWERMGVTSLMPWQSDCGVKFWKEGGIERPAT